MLKLTISAAALVLLGGMTGCQTLTLAESDSHVHQFAIEPHDTQPYTQAYDAELPRYMHRLGAGDVLGQSIYRIHMAHLQREVESMRIAAVQTPATE